MELGTVLDKRTGFDRRVGGPSDYAGPERRKNRDRRSEIITVCAFCHKVCGDQSSWFKSPQPMEATSADFLIDVCEDCSSKQFNHVFSNTQPLRSANH